MKVHQALREAQRLLSRLEAAASRERADWGGGVGADDELAFLTLQVANLTYACSRSRELSESFLLGAGLDAILAATACTVDKVKCGMRRTDELELERFQLFDALRRMLRSCRSKAAIRRTADSPLVHYASMVLDVSGRDWTVSTAVLATIDVLGTLCAGGDHCAHRVASSMALQRAGEVLQFCRERPGSPWHLRDVERGVARLFAAAGMEERDVARPLSARQTGRRRAPMRILSLDGGGTRAVVAIEILRSLEALTKRPIRESFDLIAGTSSGGILAIALGLKCLSLDECEALVKDMAKELFASRSTADALLGPGKALLYRGAYNSTAYEELLARHLGSEMLIDTRAHGSDDPDPPRVCAVSTLVSRTPAVPFLHSNYRLPRPLPGTKERRFQHSCHHRSWEAARATSAAPYYFSAFRSGDDVFCDGAILVNNPALVALRESRMLWRRRHLQCLVSVGTGRSEQGGSGREGFLALGRTVLESATETETTHRALEELLPENKYFRFSPVLEPEQTTLDEYRDDKLEDLKNRTRKYLHAERTRLQELAAGLRSAAPTIIGGGRSGRL